MFISVIIPAYNASQYLRQCLQAIYSSAYRSFECIVVDDGSTDDLSAVCESFQVAVLHIAGGPRGPAFARNKGAEVAKGELLFFVDADVVIQANTLSQIAALFAKRPTLAAAFGSYDLAPGAPNFVSQYKNLFHHYVHQHASADAATFWSGCGAVRRAIFWRVGGFDAERYPRASIEDIEFGRRLKLAGHSILLDKELHVQHLKRWTLPGLIKCDVLNRAIPWTRLIFEDNRVPNDLNLRRSQRISSALVCLWLLLCAGLATVAPQALALPLLGLLMLLLAGGLVYEEGDRFALEPFRGPTLGLLTVVLITLAALGGLLPSATLFAPPVVVLLGLLLLSLPGRRPRAWNNFLHSAIIAMPVACAVVLLAQLPAWLALILCAPLAGILLLNLDFYRFFVRLRGPLFSLAVVPFHILYYLYSMVGLAAGIGLSVIERRKSAATAAGRIAPS